MSLFPSRKAALVVTAWSSVKEIIDGLEFFRKKAERKISRHSFLASSRPWLRLCAGLTRPMLLL